jgi:hypothetical protein
MGRLMPLLFHALMFVSSASPLWAVTGAAPACDASTTIRLRCNVGWDGSGCRDVVTPRALSCPGPVSNAILIGRKHQPIGGLTLLTGVMNSPSPPPEQARDERARTILQELDANPLDDKAQGDARSVIQSCKTSATIEDMHHCSGLLVTPVTRLNCLNQGICTPLPWKPDAVPNGRPQWFGWQKYSDTTDVQVAVVLQPWITTPEVAKQCANSSLQNGKGNQQDRFVLCLARHMGGAATKRALSCYSRYLQSPGRFSGCLEGVAISQGEEAQINCVLGIHPFGTACEKALHLTSAEAMQCTAQPNQSQAQFADCLRKLRVSLPLTAQCAAAAGGDATMLGQCLKGSRTMGPKSTVVAIQTCIDTARATSKGDPSRLRTAMIRCATRHGASKSLIDQYARHEPMVSCFNNPHLDFDHRADCLRSAGLALPPTPQLSACVEASHTPLDAAGCVNLPGVDNIRKAEQCIDKGAGSPSMLGACVAEVVPFTATKRAACLMGARNGNDAIHCASDKVAIRLDQVQHCMDLAKDGSDGGKQCLAKLFGLPLAKVDLCFSASKGAIDSKGVIDLAECAGMKGISVARAAEACFLTSTSDPMTTAECLSGAAGFAGAREALCMVRAHTGFDILACTGDKALAKVIAVKECLNTDSEDYGREAVCIAAQASLPPAVGHLFACAANASTYEQGAACMIAPALGPQMAMAVKCGSEAQGSPTGMAICMAGPSMNAELRIAAECAASTGGEPTSFTACAGGRLTMKEIQQCISGGFKSEKGCFGPNNTIVRYFDAEEKVLRGVMRAAGLEHAYDSFLSDLHHGRLGKNNDIVKAINLIGMGSPDSVGRRFMQGFGLYGQLLIGGTVELKTTVAAAKTILSTLVTAQLALVPSVTLGPDHIAVSLGNSGVNIEGGHVGGTFLGKRWSL